jgi:glycolate oxidase
LITQLLEIALDKIREVAMGNLASDLRSLLDKNKVKTEPEDLYSYSSDSIRYHAKNNPDAVVLPSTTEDVSKVIKYALKNSIPVTPRGAGSGLSGGCTPVDGGIVLDMKRMNSIIEINRGNMTATCEAGVVLANFHRSVEKINLFYPPDPQSMSVCTIGGNVATRAGGPRGVKYGTTGNYVLGLEFVLPDGEVINTGGSCVKNSVGYDITHLMTGAEGTLGVITKVTSRLIPLPPCYKTIIIGCAKADLAAQIVSSITANAAVPSMLEYISQAAAGFMNSFINPPLIADMEAYLFLKLDGTQSQIEYESKKIETICRDMGVNDIRVVEDEVEAKSYWEARSKLYPLLVSFFKQIIAEDVTVPRDKFPELLRALPEISAATGLLIGAAGHAGDGNVHPSILLGEINEEVKKKTEEAIDMIINKAIDLGGCISGEHGIGLHKAAFLEKSIGKRQVELLKQIKNAIDPAGIMNPGKIWTREER